MRVSEVDQGALIDAGKCFAFVLDDLLTLIWATGWQIGELAISSEDARRLLVWAETDERIQRVEGAGQSAFGFKHPVGSQFIKVIVDPTLEIQAIHLSLMTVA